MPCQSQTFRSLQSQRFIESGNDPSPKSEGMHETKFS